MIDEQHFPLESLCFSPPAQIAGSLCQDTSPAEGDKLEPGAMCIGLAQTLRFF